ncbi:MAG: peptidase T [Lachnospiraceae bacterium]|nr:peptidase T [Lachnospiraceae bacterium]
MTAVERFLDYVSFDTMSVESIDAYPSTPGQRELLDHLRDQLKELGVSDVRQDAKYGCVFASIPSNCPERTIPAIGFIAHVDTSEAISGKDIKPRIIEDFDGEDIVLNKELDIVTRMEDFPEMRDMKGKTVIVTDGTTLLGADDKAGVTAIMELAAYLVAHPEEKHGTVCIAFTAEEETGRGVDHFDPAGFGAHFAYTVDGGRLGDIAGETFNAAGAKLNVKGRSVHPGDAYGKMINALQVLMDFHGRLPGKERPEHTRGREGFFHITEFKGNVEEASSEYIIRDHDRERFEERKELFRKACEETDRAFGGGVLTLKLVDQYYNMKERLDPHPEVMEKALEAMRKCGVEPKPEPIRGGTDGSRLSYMGLPCPNLCTGGGNFHGKHEYLCVEEMLTTIEILKTLVREWALD